jgi:hypothetical protein
MNQNFGKKGSVKVFMGQKLLQYMKLGFQEIIVLILASQEFRKFFNEVFF